METTSDASDGDLARAVARERGGPAEAAESELYRRFAPRVRRYGLCHLRDADAAGDLVQHVMLLTIEKLRAGAVHDSDRIASFVLGVSRTMARDLKRRERRREKLRDTFIVADTAEWPEQGERLDIDRLDTCLARLAERERLVVLLTFYGEKSASETGRELGLTDGNVRVIRHRAIERLRQCIGSREDVQ